jgi:hypothetical protein
MKKHILVDILIVLLILLALGVGYYTYEHFRQTADKQIEKTSKIAFQVFLRGVTITGKENPIKVGDKTFISIRNVPYTDLQVVDSKIDTKKVLMPTPYAKTPITLVQDFSQVFMYDIIVTVEDNAKITKDGAVVGGNKIKMGLPITLEGKNYKFNGTVSDVQILSETSAQSASQVKPNMPIQQNTPAQVSPQATTQTQTGTQPQPTVQAPANVQITPKVQPKAPVPVQPTAVTTEVKK